MNPKTSMTQDEIEDEKIRPRFSDELEPTPLQKIYDAYSKDGEKGLKRQLLQNESQARAERRKAAKTPA
jgi:hypothetical protein